MGKVDEIKAGGVKGIFGVDQIQWGGRAGALYECWKIEPCCGSPVNGKDACVCLLTWWFCGFCADTRLYASSLGNSSCAIVPHCLFNLFCPSCAMCSTRYNLRKRHGVPGNIIGDIVCVHFCTCCSCLQHLRASQISDWEIWPCRIELMAPQMKLIV